MDSTIKTMAASKCTMGLLSSEERLRRENSGAMLFDVVEHRIRVGESELWAP